jgi:hypothetical protein
LLNERLFVLFGTLLHLLSLGSDVLLKLIGVPAIVGCDDLVIPVLLDEVFQVLAVCRSWIWNVVVRQPPLELCLVPFVVCYSGLSVLVSFEFN